MYGTFPERAHIRRHARLAISIATIAVAALVTAQVCQSMSSGDLHITVLLKVNAGSFAHSWLATQYPQLENQKKMNTQMHQTVLQAEIQTLEDEDSTNHKMSAVSKIHVADVIETEKMRAAIAQQKEQEEDDRETTEVCPLRVNLDPNCSELLADSDARIFPVCTNAYVYT